MLWFGKIGLSEKEVFLMAYYNNQNGGPPGMLPNSQYPPVWANEEEYKQATSQCLIRVFLRMFAALVVTAFAAFAVASSDALVSLVFGNPAVYIVLIIVELILVIAISAGIKRMSATAANVLFFVYAAINGVTLAVIFLVYDLGIIYHAFAVSALMFGGIALFGAITHWDLSKVGSICIMGLFGIIIASIANIFFRSSALESAVLYIGVLVFVGLTAYDTQRIKRMLREANGVSHVEAIKRISVIGALTLYLDFINMFLRILRILGRRR